MLDDWMQAHPWHPRALPFLLYITLIPVIQHLRETAAWTYPLTYTLQCSLVGWLLWRYRRLTPELNWRWHWLALPVGAGVFAAWVGIGWAMAGEWQVRWDALTQGRLLGLIDYGKGQPPSLATPASAGPLDPRDPALLGSALGTVTLLLRLVGMTLIVASFEELFIRSLLLRGLSSFRSTALGLIQFLQDMPVVGEVLLHSRLGAAASKQPPMFQHQFEQTPLGVLTPAGVILSTLVFTMHHQLRDYPACVVCALAYCVLLRLTAQKGLGPTVWAHAITNALIWAYTLKSGDWQFM